MDNDQIDLRVSQELTEYEQTITKVFTVSIWSSIKDLKKLVSEGFGIPEEQQRLKSSKEGKEVTLSVFWLCRMFIWLEDSKR